MTISILLFQVKFNVNRVDNMVIQSIALLDQLDKDINLFGMRIREWYAYHYPELFSLVKDQYKYVRCAAAILNRSSLNEAVIEKLKGKSLHLMALFFITKFIHSSNLRDPGE